MARVSQYCAHRSEGGVLTDRKEGAHRSEGGCSQIGRGVLTDRKGGAHRSEGGGCSPDRKEGAHRSEGGHCVLSLPDTFAVRAPGVWE